MCKETVVTEFDVPFPHLCGEIEEDNKNRSEYWCRGRDSNWQPPEHESEFVFEVCATVTMKSVDL
jgi:hypothetical protein